MECKCCRHKCCFDFFYWRCFRIRRFFRKNKTGPANRSLSPTPSIRLTAAGGKRTEEDEQSIQDQLSLFHFGQKNGSGRRYSHPNQVKYVEEYERRRGLSQPGSPSSLQPDMEFDYDEEHVNRFLEKHVGNENDEDNDKEAARKSPTSPVMEDPVVPPGRNA